MYQKAKVEASEKEHIAAPASTMLADAWIRLKKNKAAVVALFILIGIILLAIFAPIFSKYSFRDTDYNNVYGLPSAAHILVLTSLDVTCGYVPGWEPEFPL